MQLIDSFLEDAPHLLAELDQYIKRGDSGGVRRIAHGLKSNGVDFGAMQFSALCKELEAIGKSGALEGAGNVFSSIVTEYERAASALAGIRQAGKIG